MRQVAFDSRTLVVCGLDDDPVAAIAGASRFAALVPACSPAERERVEAIAPALIARGCVEICCVGPQAELLHEALDWLCVDRGAFVLTVGDTDLDEGCWHFLFTATSREADLVAFVEDHEAFLVALERARAQRA